MRPIVVTAGPVLAAAPASIAALQTPTGAGALALDGSYVNLGSGIAVMPNATAVKVIITSAGDNSGVQFTVVGTNQNNALTTETLPGPNAGSVTTTNYFLTVISVSVSAATAGAVSVGSSALASSAWVNFDTWSLSQTSIQVDVLGIANYTVQQTLDDPNSPTNPVAPIAMQWINHPDVNLVNATSTAQSNYGYIPAYARVLLNSGSGSVRATFTQSGVNPV